MPLVLNGTKIEQVGVVDDSQDTRETISDDLRDVDLTPQPFPGPFASTEQLLSTVWEGSDALVCDHHLSPRNYAPCTGAEVVSRCYERQFPSVLVTKYGKAEVDQIRLYRRGIPVLIPSDESNPDLIAKGFAVCVEEFNDRYTPTRKPWKNMVRIDDVNVNSNPINVYVVVPGWNESQVIRLPIDIFPAGVRDHVRPKERFFAHINMGAETQEELYFVAIEYRGR